MIKVAVSRSNNNRISLELLASRVCTRKVVALQTASATKYKAIVPSAAVLARSAFLYHGMHHELLADTSRWEACREASMVPGDPFEYNPSLKTTPEQLWAVKYNTLFMKRVREHEKHKQQAKDFMVALGVPDHVPTALHATDSVYKVWVCCAVSRSQAMMLPATLSENGELFIGCKESSFNMSVDLIASTHEKVEAAAKAKSQRLKMYTQLLRIAGKCDSDTDKIFLNEEGEKRHLCDLRARYQRNNAPAAEANAQRDVEGDHARAVADEHVSSDEDDDVTGGGIEDANNAKMAKFIMGWDDLSGGEDDCEATAADVDCDEHEEVEFGSVDDDNAMISELDALNLKLAASAAEAAQTDSTSNFESVADKVAKRCTSSRTRASTLSPVDEETEAFLQDILLDEHHMHSNEHTASSAARQPACSSNESKQTSAGAASASGVAVHETPSSVRDTFLAAWKDSVAKSCAALVHRHEYSDKMVGENSYLDQILNSVQGRSRMSR